MTQKSRIYRLTQLENAVGLSHSNEVATKPAPHQVLVKIGAASLNYRDLLVLQNSGSNRAGLIPLSDGAGTILEVGSEVSRWKVGDRVSPIFFPNWQGGASSPARLAIALGGGQTDGILSDIIAVDATAVVAIAPHLTLAEAATLPCAGVTAWHALFARGALQADETVLVQGTGGVAMLGLQLAAEQGARVIVISSSDAKLERARALGAWQTINYRSQPDWDRVVLEVTDGTGVDHILELGGPETYQRSIAAVAHGGRISQIGVLSGFSACPNIEPLQYKNASIHGICVGSAEHFDHLNHFLATHRIHPVIDRQFAFDEVTEAYQQLKNARHFGKLVIDMTR